MFNKKEILEKTINILERGNFIISRSYYDKSSFDVLARKRERILLIKVLVNIDSLDYKRAQEMFTLAKTLASSPLIIGIKTTQGKMENGVVYERYGIFAVTPQTFEDILLKNLPPLIFSHRGGYYVKIDGKILKKKRKERNLSLRDVADRIGVSRKTIYEYEHSNMCATLKTALKLEEYFETPIAKPIHIFSIARDLFELKSEYTGNPDLEKLRKIGFKVYPIKKAPFSALTKGKDEILLTKTLFGPYKLETKAKILKSISRTIKTQAFFVIKKTKQKCIEGVPIIQRKELELMEEPQELIDILKERANFI